MSAEPSRPRVPLFAVVFHTHLAAVGAARDGPSLRETPELFLRHQMQPLVHGSQLGWLSSEIPELVEKHPDLVACFKAAVDLRRRFGTMLGYGKLLRPPVVRSATGAAASSFAADGPAILSGFFREPNEQGKALAVFCNWTGQVREAVAELDLEELARPVQATFVDGAQIGRFDQRTATVRLQLPPRSVAAILLDPTPNTR